MSSSGVSVCPMVEDLSLALSRLDGLKLPNFSEESILVYLSIPGSSLVPMRVLENESIASMKLKIQNYKGFVAKKQRLVCDGRELARSNSLVKEYGVGSGDVLHLVVRMSHVRTITVETKCGKKFEFNAERIRNIAYIKQEIARKGLLNLTDQKLLCDGEELDDQLLIADIHNDNDAVIHLLVCESAKVHSEHAGKECELSIEAASVDDTPDGSEISCKTSGRNFKLEPILGNSKIEVSHTIRNLINSVFLGLDKGNPPVLTVEGSGGAYLMQDATGCRYVAVFKPCDEEPMALNNPRGLPLSQDGEGLKRGTRVGEGALREVAAYILDHPASGHRSFVTDEIGLAGVPPTQMVRCLHGGFNHPTGYFCTEKNFKIGSLQMFVSNHGSCEDMGPCAFPVEEVHKISVLDIRLANADRHGGNILVSRGDQGRITLIPIDHGYCLSENFEDCTFEWLNWPQAQEPYKSETIEYIKSLDAEEDIAILKFHGWELPADCARTLRISTMLLKKGVERGLTPFAIGSILCRETVMEESKIEGILHEARETVLPCSSEVTFMEAISGVMDHYLDICGDRM